MLAKTHMRPYAQAAFMQAQEEDALVSWRQLLSALVEIMRSEEVSSCVANPFLDQPALLEVLCSVLVISPTQRTFLMDLLSRHYLGQIEAILSCFEEYFRAYYRIQRVRIETAFPLSEEELARLAQILENQLDAQIEWVVSVQPALLAGVLLRIGDDVIDASVRGRLAQLTRALA